MKQISKNKKTKKLSKFSNIIEKKLKNSSPLEDIKNENKEKIINKNKEKKIIYLNKLDEKIYKRKIRSKKEIKYNHHILFNSLIYKNNNIKSFRDEPNILLYIIIIFFLISLTNEFLLLRQLNYFNSITITFKENGANQFLSQRYDFKPDYVLLNENPIEYQQTLEGKYTIFLNESELTIKLGWNDTPKSCSNMFNGMRNLIAIDLSEFDTSKVIDMSYMFNECTNLVALNLRNIDISSVTNFNSMFKLCTR